jgi:hypothetical protein
VLITGRFDRVQPNVAQTTTQIHRLGVESGPLVRWRAMVGPNPAEASVTYTLKQTLPGLELNTSGWIWASGRWSYVGTSQVWVTASGTDCIVQVEGTKHRVFLLKGWITVKNLPPEPEPLIMRDANTYIEVELGATELPDPKPIPPAPDPLGVFVAYVTGTARVGSD